MLVQLSDLFAVRFSSTIDESHENRKKMNQVVFRTVRSYIQIAGERQHQLSEK